ncbi:mucin-17 isoform X7 [Aethina tumida]|uniref:mucin-17 isoform X7 n=1 Tax=Aethina tumida TaxID=116153 RepID=UPI0021489520|nr:mucin-17 isoform X7 [Aethina tumida]
MKPSIILLLVCLLCADAQRRAPSRDAPEPEKQPDKAPSHPRGRGRARFTTTPEFTQITEAQKQETTTRKRVNPVALERRTQTAPASRTYEVSEIVEESPIDSFKRQSKPRVLTESRFEARNAPKKPLFEPAPSTPEPTVDELLKSFGSNLETTIPDISITTIKQDLDSTSEDSEIASANNVLPSTEPSKQDNEIKKENSKAPETTTKTEQRRPQNRRVNVVARGRATPIQTEVSTQASRTRGRTRPTRKPEVTSASTTTASTRAALRTGRRRSEIPEPIKSRGPSVLLAEETREAPSRSRTGRRINNRVEEKSPEKITIDLNAAPVTNSNSRSRFSGKPTARSETSTPSRRAGSRFPSRTATTEASRSTTSALPVTKGTTHVRKALRSRTRVTTTTLSPPVFDEQKLEVLPLFETEAKTVLPAKTKRNFSGEEMSATETDNKFTAKPNDIQSRVTVSHRVETRKQTYFKRKVTKRPLVKETVVAEVTEVTSRSTARKRNNEIPVEIKGRIKVDDPKVSVSSSISRGRKKSSARNKSDLTSSEEDIEDGDNYPKEFKALIQAKKNKKESRLPPRTNPTTGRTNDVASTVPSTVPTVTTTTQSTTTTVTTEAVKENADLENEVLPKTTAPTFRPTRKRIVKVLEKTTPRRQPSTTRQKVVRSTTFAPIESTRTSHRFHAKFNSKPESSESSLRTEKNYKSSRNRYSSRKSKETVKEEKSGKVPTEPTIKPTQISRNAAGAKKSNRFSAKYRGDTSLRGARSSTAAPAYIPTIPTAPYVPTIPTLVPPTTTIKWSKGTLDKDLGLEVLTIDDPVAYTVPSANLVNEEFVSPTNSNRLSNSVVTTTEKPVSIIERIINSITAISTTAVPDAMTTPFTTPKTEPSAILKLATKKPTKQDKTQPDKTNNPSITTEKPTTIIERILSSLSAIQADDEINSNKDGTSTVPPTTARTTLKPTESTSSVPSTTEPPKPTEPPTQPTTTEATTKPTEPPPPPSSSEVSVIGRVAEVPENTENILTTTTAEPIQTTTQTEPPVTTTLRTTTEAIRYTSTPTTTYQTFEPIVTSIRPTLAPITTLFPNFLTTLLSTLQPVTLAPPTTQETPKEVNTDQILAATTIAPSTSAPFLSTRGRVGYFDTISTDIPLTTRRRTQPPITITTNPPTTTQSPTRLPLTTRVSRTTIPTRTTIITSVPYVETTTSKRLKELTEEQKQNLKTLAELEKEQAALLNQLSILTSFANGGRKPASENGNLANRIIALAMDRDRTKTTTEGTTVSVRGGKKLEPSLDEVLKQYNLQGLESVTASPSPSSASTFGKSNEALIASLLKQQGIGPTTPSILQGIYTQTTTRPPRTTTRQPGRILQGLNWLLNALSPQPQAPRQKPRPKTTTSSPSDDELLTNLPTHITPVVTAAPKIRPNQLSQEDIKKLINQLETLQKNPRDSKALDFTQIKSLQNLINTNEGVLVTSSGESGTTRPSTRMIATTQLPAITTNLIVEEEDYVPTTTTRPRISLPPVRLNPVPGVDDENSDPYIRGNLITAAVNVTRAISSFLGSALQDAAFQFTKMFSSNPSSLLPNVANFTAISG